MPFVNARQSVIAYVILTKVRIYDFQNRRSPLLDPDFRQDDALLRLHLGARLRSVANLSRRRGIMKGFLSAGPAVRR